MLIILASLHSDAIQWLSTSAVPGPAGLRVSRALRGECCTGACVRSAMHSNSGNRNYAFLFCLERSHLIPFKVIIKGSPKITPEKRDGFRSLALSVTPRQQGSTMLLLGLVGNGRARNASCLSWLPDMVQWKNCSSRRSWSGKKPFLCTGLDSLACLPFLGAACEEPWGMLSGGLGGG